MLQLGQLHLQLAFVAPGTLGEDVEDQARSVDHAATQFLFQVALLGGRKFVVENGDIGTGISDGIRHLGHLAFARKERGVRAFPAPLHDGDSSGPRG